MTASEERGNAGGKRPFETRKFFLTNTMSGKREEFWPQNPPQVLFYSCGPTVYGPLHIGNARALLFSDLLFRWLKYIGYDVNYVRNYTDVDDKIIARAKEEKVGEREIADRYIAVCEHDMSSLGIQNPTRTVRVTDSMDDIVGLIGKIVANGHAYVVDGEVLFSIESFKSYGKLSGRNVDELQAGARVEIDRKKRSPLDFALWKPYRPVAPSG
ncbi:MAG: class I tRNA ligase family protein, partial [Deltaproteobacteria bacterium]|nr:class I tRNA ligase family protein [Deltaproteobacteria bacterium]